MPFCLEGGPGGLHKMLARRSALSLQKKQTSRCSSSSLPRPHHCLLPCLRFVLIFSVWLSVLLCFRCLPQMAGPKLSSVEAADKDSSFDVADKDSSIEATYNESSVKAAYKDSSIIAVDKSSSDEATYKESVQGQLRRCHILRQLQ